MKGTFSEPLYKSFGRPPFAPSKKRSERPVVEMMKRLLESLVGKTNAVIGVVLVACLAALLWVLSGLFENN